MAVGVLAAPFGAPAWIAGPFRPRVAPAGLRGGAVRIANPSGSATRHGTLRRSGRARLGGLDAGSIAAVPWDLIAVDYGLGVWKLGVP